MSIRAFYDANLGASTAKMLTSRLTDLSLAVCEYSQEPNAERHTDIQDRIAQIMLLLSIPGIENIDGADCSVLAEIWVSKLQTPGMDCVVRALVEDGDRMGMLSAASPSGESLLTRTVQYGATELFEYLRAHCWDAVTVPGYNSLDRYLETTSPEIAAYIRADMVSTPSA